MSQAWTRTEQGYRCTRHGLAFGALSTCPQCASDPAPLVVEDESEDIPAPQGCASTLEHEIEFTRMAGVAERMADKLAKRANASTALAKILDTAIKARRAASALARAREDDELILRLEKRKRDLGGRH